MTADIEALLAAVPEWAGRELSVRPLPGGITNRNYVVTVDGREVVARIPGERTALLGIDRANEAEAARRAAELGIGPPVVGVLPGVGTLLTELVPGGHLGGVELTAALDPIVDLVATFHRSGPLAGRFPIHRVVEAHACDAAAHGVIVPAVYEQLHEASGRIEAAMGEHPVDAVPCHNDLLPANLLFDGGRAWLLDFEYAGMNDPFFDLGNLAVNCAFDAPAERRLVERYLGHPSPSGQARLALMKVMSELREGMWGVVQQAISTLAEDFAGYAAGRLEHCRRLVDDPSFAVALEAARAPL